MLLHRVNVFYLAVVMLLAFRRKLRNYSTHSCYADFAGIRYKILTVSECSHAELEGSNISRSNTRVFLCLCCPVKYLSCNRVLSSPRNPIKCLKRTSDVTSNLENKYEPK